MKKMKDTCKLDIINQCQKISYPVQKLRENNVEGIDIMQISGHSNVAFINNYSSLSEVRQENIKHPQQH